MDEVQQSKPKPETLAAVFRRIEFQDWLTSRVPHYVSEKDRHALVKSFMAGGLIVLRKKPNLGMKAEVR